MAEVKREYYSTGELKEEWFEINGKREGEYKKTTNNQKDNKKLNVFLIKHACYQNFSY